MCHKITIAFVSVVLSYDNPRTSCLNCYVHDDWASDTEGRY